MLKKTVLVIFLLIIAIISFYWEWVSYGFLQAKGQMKVILEARPIDVFLKDPGYPDSLKTKLRLTKQVRFFATEELGLNSSDNYTTLFDQKGEVLLWNVSACEPYALNPYEWQYLFLGKMPYKGFFDIEKAKKEATYLKNLGYDTRIRPVGGWSTLGILQDPLLSNMLERSQGALAELIIHELTHATLFVKDDINFNENLASFVGEKGAIQFLTQTFGERSPAIIEYERSEEDQKQLTEVVLSGARTLDSLYSHFSPALDSMIKDSLKQMTIENIRIQLRTTPFHNDNYQELFDDQLPNNAYFMAFRRYHEEGDTLQAIYQDHNGDIKNMIQTLKTFYAK